MVSDAPTPHSPPIAMPYSARRIRNTVSVGAKPVANSSAEYSTTSTISVGRRPKRSASRPNRNAPIARVASVSVMA